MQPLESDELDPGSAIANAPGVTIECRADPEQQTVMQMRNEGTHKKFLPRSADPYPNDVGPAGVQTIDDAPLLLARQITKGRRICACDTCGGNLLDPQLRQFISNARLSAVKEMRVFRKLRPPGNGAHQIR